MGKTFMIFDTLLPIAHERVDLEGDIICGQIGSVQLQLVCHIVDGRGERYRDQKYKAEVENTFKLRYLNERIWLVLREAHAPYGRHNLLYDFDSRDKEYIEQMAIWKQHL